MPEGFFSKSTLAKSRPPSYTLPQCGACGLYKGINSPKMPVSGDGRKGILVVAEAPSEDEDKHGTQLIGKTGQEFRATLDKHGIDLDRDCWKTNSIICWPGEGNPTPTDSQISYCRPNVKRTIRELKPTVILLLGGPAVKSVMDEYCTDSIGGISRWVGWQIPLRPLNTWVCPTYHPSFVSRDRDGVAAIYYNKHVAEAVLCADKGRPWPDGAPDIADQVRVEMDDVEAAKWLSEIIARGGPISFDYETNMLKPDSPDARIICASVCWRGRRTLAFPWRGMAIDAMRALLVSPVKKVGLNTKFEQRWTMAKLGCRVARWVWCGMQAAHVCDNRPKITSCEFQALVRLGVPEWNSHIKPFLEAQGTNVPNQAESEIDIKEFCLYCGIDSACEYHIAKHQVAELNYPLEL